MACGAQQNPETRENNGAPSSLAVMNSEIVASVPLQTTLKAFCKNGETYSATSHKGKVSLFLPSNLACYMMSEHKPLDSNNVFTTKLALLIEGRRSTEFKIISEKLVLEFIDLAMSEEEIIDKNGDYIVDKILNISIETGEVSMVDK